MFYNVQVANGHYNMASYDSLDRFISYYHQKELILKYAALKEGTKVLEIGKGNGFLDNYLGQQGLYTKTFDLAADLKPDYIGSILEISKIVRERFDIVCAFEVLEHIKFEDVPRALEEVWFATDSYVIISIPQSGLRLSLWANFDYRFFFRKAFQIRSVKKFIPNTEHYWELARPGYEIYKFRKLLGKLFNILEEFTDPLDNYHRYYVLKKK